MDDVAKVREKIDIVALISEYLTLKKAGRNFKTACPFHNEKTPSFVISPERQIWHCFGCQKGGDCFTFLMEYENLEFPEALRMLAKRAGVELKDVAFNKGVQSKKEKILNLNEKAGKFYSYLLEKHAVGKKALEYLLEKRKIPKGLVESFEIGFSPSIGNSLSEYLTKKKGFNKQDLFEAGLSFESRGGVSDFFKGRLMFPLKDHRGNIVGFSARQLEDSNPPAGGGPKYINTKDTPAYHKGELFFGLDKAKEEIKKLNQAIVVEGEFDVISCFKEGIKNVIAIKGTALTESQVALLSRFCQKVTLCLDQDEAGLEAAKRSLVLLEKRDLITTIIIIPNGKDPDEAIKSDPIAFKKAVKNDVGIYDFLVEKIVSQNDKATMDGKRKIAEELLTFFAHIGNEVVKEHYLKKLSKEIDTSLESLQKQLEKIQTGAKTEEVLINRKSRKSRRDVLEEYLLSLIIQQENAKEMFKLATNELGDYEYEVLSIKKIMEHLATYFKNLDNFDQKKFANGLPKELLPIFDASFIFPLLEFQTVDLLKGEIVKICKELSTIYFKDKIGELAQKIQEAKKTNQKEQVGNLEREFTEFIAKLPKSP
jgi:DNA primase